MKEIEYGYHYRCEHCGVENAYGLTEQEADDYIREWEADNRDLVQEGETGESACDWWYNVTAAENSAHIEDGEKCWKCRKTQTKWAG